MTTPSAPGMSLMEARFERWRKKAGLVGAPLVFALLWVLPIDGLSLEAHRLLAILGLTIVLWITEAIPLAAAALLGPALCVVMGVGQAKEVFAGFSNPVIFLFLGSFLIAEAMLEHGLNRRIAFSILSLRVVGRNPGRLLVAFGLVSGAISLWISNTATTAMMYPIGLAILHEMARGLAQRTGQDVDLTRMPYATGLMLITAFGASIGGLGTPVGTPPNLIGLGVIHELLGLRISFFQWMLFGTPLAAVLIFFLALYLKRACPAAPAILDGGADWIRAERAKLGPLGRAEIYVLAVFGATVFFWILPGILTLVLGQQSAACLWLEAHLPEAMVALLGALPLFILPLRLEPWQPTLTWEAARRVDWGTILLFGGGLALGNEMFRTGLAEWIGRGLAQVFQAHSTLGLTVLFTAVAIVVSETTSNAASAAMVVPVAITVSQAAGVPPLQPALAACLGASMGFMLPVSTPPNAIVYGSGCIPIARMVRYGLLLDVAGFVAIVACVQWLVPWVVPVPGTS